jgi:hypothetical protein
VPQGDGLPVAEPPNNFATYTDEEDSVSSNSEEYQLSASRDSYYEGRFINNAHGGRTAEWMMQSQ